MKTFEQFINEELNVRELMTPKSDDDLRKVVTKLKPNEKLAKACLNNLIWLAKEAIEEGGDINNDKSPLKYAIKRRHFEILEFLLDNGADPDRFISSEINRWGLDEEILELLLKYSKKYSE